MSTEIDPLRAAGSLIRLVRLLEQSTPLRSRDDELGLAELGVLGEIGRGTELPSAIARATRVDPARVTRIAERLVRLGLVTRGVSAHDRRLMPLALTESGQRRLEQGRVDIRDAMAGLMSGLTDQERAAFAVALEGVQRVLAEAL